MRTTAIALLLLGGCIDEFHGSNVQIDLSATTPVQASVGVNPTTEQLPDNIHFTLYAFEQDDANGTPVGRLFEVETFEIHRIVDLASPCSIDVGEHVPFPGLHVSQYAAQVMAKYGWTSMTPPPTAGETEKVEVATAIQRQRNIEAQAGNQGLKVVSGASNGGYLEVGADCSDTTKLPPPMCTDADSNARRLAMCQEAWSHDPEYFEGTDRVLTVPLNGTTHGMVTGSNPVNLAPVGGAQFFVDESLDDFQGYAIYWQYDDANHDGVPDYPASLPMADRRELGTQLLYGKPSAPTRGVIHVDMSNRAEPSLTAELAIFASLDDDEVHF
ncbi:MAG TPA: hypothetical protein VMZ53_32425 [Kofleriaceae bacterium]|nr:hypothetical protein [Kofleriaceae bacterium]